MFVKLLTAIIASSKFVLAHKRVTHSQAPVGGTGEKLIVNVTDDIFSCRPFLEAAAKELGEEEE